MKNIHNNSKKDTYSKYGRKLVKEMLEAQCKFVIPTTNPNQVGYCIYKIPFQPSSLSWIYIGSIHTWLILKILSQKFHYVDSRKWCSKKFLYGIDISKGLSNNIIMLKCYINRHLLYRRDILCLITEKHKFFFLLLMLQVDVWYSHQKCW